MPLLMVQNEITKMRTDAIVLPAIGDVKEGCQKATISQGKDLPADWVVQIACPSWYGGGSSAEEKLCGAYKEALHLTAEKKLKSVAVPLLSTGDTGWPRAQALNITSRAIRDFLQNNEMDVYLVLQNRESVLEGTAIQQEIEAYIDDNFEEMEYELPRFMQDPIVAGSATKISSRVAAREETYNPETCDGEICEAKICEAEICEEEIREAEICEEEIRESEHLVKRVEAPRTKYEVDTESFHRMLFKLIDESGLKNADVYKAANMSKQLFSKIKSNPGYAPTKKTIVSLAIALKLDLEKTNKLLMTEGYILTNCLLFDTIVKYFIEHENYSIWDINEALWEYGFEDKDLFGFN